MYLGSGQATTALTTKLHIAHTEQSPCGTGSQTTKRLLQFCLFYELFKKARKLYIGSLEDLQRIVAFVAETGVSI